jgi:hypothetical protein
MDIAQAFAVPERLTFGGREFTARQLTLVEWAALQAWLKGAGPSPVTQVLRSLQEARDLGFPLTPDVREAALAHAQEEARRWPPAFGSRAWLRALDSVPGGTERFVAHVLALAGQPLDDQEVLRLVERATVEEFAELTRIVYFGDPPTVPAPERDDPKAPAPAPGPTTGDLAFTSSRRGSATPRSAG